MNNPTIEPAKRPAIERDTGGAEDRDITSIPASEFLSILDKEGLGAASLNLLPEKKKFELFLEPEWTRAVKVRDLVRALKSEKKKVELEWPLDLGARINPPFVPAEGIGTRYPASRYPGYSMTRESFGGGVSYPNPDDPDRRFPWPVEIRKSSLDNRFEQVTAQLTQLQGMVQELRSQLESVRNR